MPLADAIDLPRQRRTFLGPFLQQPRFVRDVIPRGTVKVRPVFWSVRETDRGCEHSRQSRRRKSLADFHKLGPFRFSIRPTQSAGDFYTLLRRRSRPRWTRARFVFSQ